MNNVHAQVAGDLGFAEQFNAEIMAFRTALLSSGRIIPRLKIVQGSSNHPNGKPDVRHSIAGN